MKICWFLIFENFRPTYIIFVFYYYDLIMYDNINFNTDYLITKYKTTFQNDIDIIMLVIIILYDFEKELLFFLLFQFIFSFNLFFYFLLLFYNFVTISCILMNWIQIYIIMLPFYLYLFYKINLCVIFPFFLFFNIFNIF